MGRNHGVDVVDVVVLMGNEWLRRLVRHRRWCRSGGIDLLLRLVMKTVEVVGYVHSYSLTVCLFLCWRVVTERYTCRTIGMKENWIGRRAKTKNVCVFARKGFSFFFWNV